MQFVLPRGGFRIGQKNNNRLYENHGSSWFIQTAAIVYWPLCGPDGIYRITIERLYLIGF